MAPIPPTRVLVVDDEEGSADTIAELLHVCGLDARAAYDGSSAIDIYREFRADVAFVDLGLPDIDGCEVARRLRALSSAIYLVALTGHAYSDVRDQVDAAGFDEHLVKPVRLEQLESAISRRRAG